jgi:hypothetical protein
MQEVKTEKVRRRIFIVEIIVFLWGMGLAKGGVIIDDLRR